MAIGTHLAKFAFVDTDNDSATRPKHVIAEDGAILNSTGNPTLEDYLVLEAADNYVLSLITESSVLTVSAADLNSA